jgi:hypothetical protein
LSDVFAPKPVPLIVRFVPADIAEDDKDVILGIGRFAVTRPAKSASTSASPIFVDPLRLASPTELGNAGFVTPPTVNAVTRASPIFTFRLPLMSPRSTILKPIALETASDCPSNLTTVTGMLPGVVSAVVITDPFNCVGAMSAVSIGVEPRLMVEAASKFWPLTVSANGPPNSGAVVWLKPEGVAERLLITGVLAPAGDVTVKQQNEFELPPGSVTVTVRGPTGASAAITMVTGMLVSVPPLSILPVTNPPLNVTAVAPIKFVPTIVAGTVVPRASDLGDMEIICGAMTCNV